MSPTIFELQARIGFPPGRNIFSDQDALREKIIQSALLSINLRDWVKKQGITSASASSAKHESLIRAYVIPAYLNTWRKSVNPNWGLLDTASDDDASAAASAEGARSETVASEATSAAAVPVQSDVLAAQNAAFLKTLFAQIETTVAKLVDARVAQATIKVDPQAKEIIRTLARDTAHAVAHATVAELMPPRAIEIRNRETQTVVNVGLQHERFPLLLRSAQARDHRGARLNIWLTGPTGSGKTSAAEAAARALALPFGSDGSLDADYKVLGFRDAQGRIVSTQFLDIYENGGVYVADEIDNWAPSALLSLNAALANGWTASPRGLVKRHPDTCIIACANTWGMGATNDYVGRTKLDAASLDRFFPKIDWPYDEILERAIARAQGEALGTAWHGLVVAARAAAKRQGLKIIVSPRATFTGIALLREGFSVTETVAMTVAAGLSTEQGSALGLAALARACEAALPKARFAAEDALARSADANSSLFAEDDAS